MTKRAYILALLSVFALFAFVPSGAKAASPNIAVVDVEKILAEAKAAQSLQKQIQSKKEAFQKEFSGKEKQLKTDENALLAEKDKLSAEEFGKKRKAYEAKVIETRKLFEKRRNSLEDGLQKAMQQLRKSILESAAQVADEKKYDIVLTRESVLIAGKTLDITADVLTKLDAKLADVQLKVE